MANDQDSAQSSNPAVQGLFNAFKVKKDQTSAPAPTNAQAQDSTGLEAMKRRMASYSSGPTRD